MTFIGFQIKDYGKNSDMKEKGLEKCTKENLKKSLLIMNDNIKKTYQKNIVEFHFLFILYFNDKDKERYNKNLVKFCNTNGIKYIFYNPVLQNFYDESEQRIKKLILDDKTNIDFFSKVNPYLIFKNMKSINKIIKYLKEEINPELALKKLLQKNESKREITYLNFKEKLKSIHEEIKSFEIIGIFEIKFYELMVYPKDSYGFLFDEGNNYLFYIFNFKEEISFYKITKNRFIIKKVNMVDIIRDKKTKNAFIIKSSY